MKRIHSAWRFFGLFQLFALLLLIGNLRADEIHTKEGTVLTGKIVSEDDTTYMINMGPNMNLTVDKNRVDHVERDTPPAKSKVKVQTTSSVVAESTPTATAPETPKPATTNATAAPVKENSAPTPPVPAKPAVAAPAVAPLPGTAKTPPVSDAPKPSAGVIRKGAVGIDIVEISKPYDIKGTSLDQLDDAIFDPDTGRGKAEGRRRIASWTDAAISWGGTVGGKNGKVKWADLVVTSSITVSLPRWTARPGTDAQVVTTWQKFLDQTKMYEAKHTRIIRENLLGLTEALNQMSATTEADLRAQTKTFIDAVMDRIDKQRKGYDRREAARRPKVKES